MAQCFIGNSNLLERVDPSRGDRQINGSPANDIAFARIDAPLVKIDLVPSPTKIRSQQSTCESGTDQYEFRHLQTMNQSRSDKSRKGKTGSSRKPSELPMRKLRHTLRIYESRKKEKRGGVSIRRARVATVNVINRSQ
jgi:hypothetical protein